MRSLMFANVAKDALLLSTIKFITVSFNVPNFVTPAPNASVAARPQLHRNDVGVVNLFGESQLHLGEILGE